MFVQSKQKETDNAKDLYDQALAGDDKRLALNYGRQYYNFSNRRWTFNNI